MMNTISFAILPLIVKKKKTHLYFNNKIISFWSIHLTQQSNFSGQAADPMQNDLDIEFKVMQGHF